MKILKLELRKEFVAPDQTICNFLKMNLLAVPVVENKKPVAYMTLTHILGELLPKQVFLHADAIGKKPGNLEFTHDNLLSRLADKVIAHNTIPLLATVEHDDPIVKAASQMLEHKIPLMAVTKDGEYIGYVTYEIIGKYLFSLM